MFGRSSKETGLWRRLLQTLGPDKAYSQRLDDLLAIVAEVTEATICYLYLLDDEGRTFRLERQWQAGPPPEAEPSRSLYGEEREIYGAGEMMAAPSLDIPRTEETETDHFVTLEAGSFYTIPLRLDEADGQNGAALLVGLLQIGPLPNRKLSRSAERNLTTLHFPLALAVQQAHREAQLRQQLSVSSARSEVGQRLRGSALEVDRFVSLLLDLALTATRTEAGFVAIIEAETKRLTIRADKHLPSAFIEQIDLTPEQGLFDWSLAAETGALIVRDFEFMEHLGVRSVLAVPLLERETPLGIFALLNFERTETFEEHNLILLETFVEQIKLVVHNGRLFQTFTDQYLETVKGLAHSLDMRRPHTQDHHQQVTAVSAALAEALGLSEAQTAALHTAALIHDVGMAGIIELEGGFQADFEHPAIGASMIENLPLPPAVAQAVATHHEWFDGWGFPQGLKGEEILIEGRILAVAEFIVEMMTGNVVRQPWSLDKLALELVQRRGNQFDPRVTDAALDLARRQALPFGQPALV